MIKVIDLAVGFTGRNEDVRILRHCLDTDVKRYIQSIDLSGWLRGSECFLHSTATLLFISAPEGPWPPRSSTQKQTIARLHDLDILNCLDGGKSEGVLHSAFYGLNSRI
ncbi:hypothetical protein Tco_0693808 [Tanacetum coccineum]